ncbi:hypothetical protein CKW39_09700 [Kocuria sp. WRN011]|uniref:DUF3054 domain-containing protein n=1 Tax=Kocuria sp. WRN011 TaxID=2029858 RepID=UPI000BAFBDAE|nr:DUF3054 domain-containing protein [Kocuria sp. WRN011]PBB08091.1 hypothetical protein CKW39_09700 [Kocuria sp. WRN011]
MSRSAPSSTSTSLTPANGTYPPRSGSHRWPLFLIADLVLVTIFAALGRNAHEQSPWGALETAWPFLLGALVGWVLIRAHRRPAALFPTGVVVWLSAEIIGMLLRMLTGQGTALAFVLVSLGVLGLFLLGYRLIVLLVGRSLRNR